MGRMAKAKANWLNNNFFAVLCYWQELIFSINKYIIKITGNSIRDFYFESRFNSFQPEVRRTKIKKLTSWL